MIDPSENFVCLLIALKHFVSSAKMNIFDAEGRSLIYTRKSSGPNMLPCGTPDNTGKHLERQLLM